MKPFVRSSGRTARLATWLAWPSVVIAGTPPDPTVALPLGETRLAEIGLYQGDDCRIEYFYQPTTGTLDDFTARIDDGPPFHPAIGGGVGAGGLLSGGKPVSAARRGGELVVEWEYQLESKPLRVEWIYQIRGKALTSDVRSVVREHHLMHPVQRLYGNAKPVEIRYLINDQFVPGGLALLGGDTSRQRIRYDSGLTVWVNWNAEPWTVGKTVLPQWGFLAEGPETKAATALHDGRLGDYSECPEFVFADARSGITPSHRRNRRNIEPRLRDFTHLGGNRVRVTYEWKVGESPGGDYHCFVHGVNPDVAKPDHIAFQQDHRLPKPTTEWQPGDVIVDGPHEFAIPGDRDWFDLTIGLYQNQRLHLSGPDDGAGRVVPARLVLDRADEKITTVRRESPKLDSGSRGSIIIPALQPRIAPPAPSPDSAWQTCVHHGKPRLLSNAVAAPLRIHPIHLATCSRDSSAAA